MNNHYDEVCDIIQNDLFLIESKINEPIDTFNVFQTEPKVYVINETRVFLIEDIGIREIAENSRLYNAAVSEYEVAE